MVNTAVPAATTTAAITNARWIGAIDAVPRIARRAHRIHAHDRRDNTDRSHHEWEDHPDRSRQADRACRHAPQDHRRDESHFIRLEQVGGHACAVADIVTDIVRDRGCVARIVLGYALFHLADKIGTHIGGLGEDATTHPHEQRQQRPTEPEAEQHLGRTLLEHDEDHRRAQQPEPNREHPRDRTRAERDLQRRRQTLVRGRSGTDIATHGEGHSKKTGESRQRGARDERDRPTNCNCEVGAERVRGRHEHEHGEDPQQPSDRAELTRQVRTRAPSWIAAATRLIAGEPWSAASISRAKSAPETIATTAVPSTATSKTHSPPRRRIASFVASWASTNVNARIRPARSSVATHDPIWSSSWGDEHDRQRCGVEQTHRDPAESHADERDETVGTNDDQLRVGPLRRVDQRLCDMSLVQQFAVNRHPRIT